MPGQPEDHPTESTTSNSRSPRSILQRLLSEYVYHQPTTPADTALLIEAADNDPFLGYGCDGDSRWTPKSVREWWRNRSEVVQYLSEQRSKWDESDARADQGIAAAVRDFERYIAGGLR